MTGVRWFVSVLTISALARRVSSMRSSPSLEIRPDLAHEVVIERLPELLEVRRRRRGRRSRRRVNGAVGGGGQRSHSGGRGRRGGAGRVGGPRRGGGRPRSRACRPPLSECRLLP